ncbi:aldo/keto reductase [Rathayibacter sp. VKM Ac-2856]|uniref:aldo/keto reductase n=1 Tax=unclassified Rathayibacter TaxID=2609250 RepID=UPI001564EABE|nr:MULTISPECIES: aldo/keto reductase [unclassified Rathayibacter]NQX06326.1 aldo/keto reductase [Rathayibacter sp. VKM Ac-2858]NQX21493.1 aldo/keto reductase [Rathayibacter sp. VKM Ac-2856]
MTPAPDLRPLGGTGLRVSRITLGGAPLGSMPENFGYDVAERDAIDLVRAVLESPIRTIDTSNGYSSGRSEQRIGAGIREHGGLPDDVVVITKVDPRGDDYSGDRVRRSLEESRSRLGIDPLPLVHLHDPEFQDFATMTAPHGAVAALVEARERGEIGSVGLAGGDVRVMRKYLDLGVFDVVLVHNRWTLVDRSAGPLLDRAAELGVGVVNAAVLGGGILADTTGRSTRYGYRDASPATLSAIASMRRVCQERGTDLATAAVRFSTRQERIGSTVVGISRLERLAPTLAAAEADLPDDFWDEMESLVPSAEHWLDASPA